MACIDRRHQVVLHSPLDACEEVVHMSPSMGGLTRYELYVQTSPIESAPYHIPIYAKMHTQLSASKPTVSHSRAEAPIANGDRVSLELVSIDTDCNRDQPYCKG